MTHRYRGLQLLGQSRRSRVWLAEGADGQVAVKIAQEGYSLAAQRDAHRAVNHPAVAPCLDADPEGTWFAVPYLPNGTVDLWARGQPIERALEAAATLADAVTAIQALGLVHGDLKPANILIGADDNPTIIDVGNPGAGTAGWRAPEVEAGASPDAVADVYALGAVFYAMLARRPPFPEVDGYGRVRLPEPPSSSRPRIPAAIDELILAMLAPEPNRRPAMSTLAARIRNVAGEAPLPEVVVGMRRERESLRRAVVDVYSGQSRAIVVHGAAGSGRRTLIAEALITARRLGLNVPKHPSQRTLREREVKTAVALDGTAEGSEKLAAAMLTQGPPTLILLHAAATMPALARIGAWHLRPSPLTVDDTTLLLEHAGHDRRSAEDLRRRSVGRPEALRSLVDALGGESRPAVPLDPAVEDVLAVLRGGLMSVPALAQRVGLTEHKLLDLIEGLLDDGTIASSPDGFTLSLARGPTHREFR